MSEGPAVLVGVAEEEVDVPVALVTRVVDVLPEAAVVLVVTVADVAVPVKHW